MLRSLLCLAALSFPLLASSSDADIRDTLMANTCAPARDIPRMHKACNSCFAERWTEVVECRAACRDAERERQCVATCLQAFKSDVASCTAEAVR